eukprot:CAMPEP_0184542176 /NCGR_PEP_ID=MMETSP0199_2-20130426/1828_1 /TAXON_ID=1112570 /ORGANISM="Thraustochytrium sp., Strain LLF1b" /LENGTH=233 /DNA_ID=CAMNT_0026935943 /DNA_START=29 /DNA_END=730 /DNA_ORIENTATION=-
MSVNIKSMLSYLVVPGAFMIFRQNVDLEDPDNIFWMRAVVGGLFGLVAFFLAFVYAKIISSPTKDKKLFVQKSQLYSPETQGLLDPSSALIDPKDEKKEEITQREYDIVKLKDLMFKLLTPMTLGVFIHWYFGVVPALFAPVLVPIRLIPTTQFFRIFVRGEDEQLIRELRRPWPQPKATMMSSFQKQYMDYARSLEMDAKPAGESAGGDATQPTVLKGNKKARRKAAAAAAR